MRKFIVVWVRPEKPTSQLCEKFPRTDVYKVIAHGNTDELNRIAGMLNTAEEVAP